MQRFKLSAVCAVLAVLVAGCAGRTTGASQSGPAGDPPAPPATVVTHFLPTGTATTSVSGSCWTSSITVASATAYRCFAGRRILDPCFAVTPRGVDCYATPWSRPVHIRLTSALPGPAPLIFTHPWAIELAGGSRCLAVTGVANRMRGVALVYHCGDGAQTSSPTRHGVQWDVQRVAKSGRVLRTVRVGVMWSA